MKNLSKLISALVLTISIIGCNSKSTIDCIEFTGNLTSGEAVMVGTWTLSGINSNLEIDLTDDDTDNPNNDVYAQYMACQKDAIYVFEADRNYTFEQGFVAAGCVDKFDNVGTWQLANGQLQVANSCSQFNIIISLDASGDTFSFTNNANIVDVNGINFTVTLTYTYSKT